MTASAETWAVDTSVAVAAVDGAHLHHASCRAAVLRTRPALAGHAGFEFFAVVTRLPGLLSVDPGDAASLIARAFPERVWLTAQQSDDLLARLPGAGVRGGAVYDALVGEAARVNGRTLLTRDQRAVRTYDVLGVPYQLVP